MSTWPVRRGGAGFTLVELLVAIAVMALLALLSWRGIDALLRTQAVVRERTEQVSVLQTGLAQWTADLEAMIELAPYPAIDFDSRVLRLVRVDASLPERPLRVVGWSRRILPQAHGGRGSWVRWQSPPLSDAQSLAQAWQQVQRWAETPAGTGPAEEVAVAALDGWQLFYFRNNAWSNPLSSADAEPGEPGPSRSATPDGVRLVLQLSPGRGQGLGGEITKDWVRPSSPPAR